MIISIGTLIYIGILAFYDVTKGEIPVWLLWCGAVFATAVAVYQLVFDKKEWEELLLGAVPAILFLLLSRLSKGVGNGDGIVLLQMDGLLFMERLIMAFGISMVVIALFSAILLLLKKSSLDRRIPYIPFLWLGCLGAVWLCG